MNLRILISIALAVGIILSFLLLLQDIKDTTRELPQEMGEKVSLDQFAGWSFYTAPNGSFTVLFPAEPKITQKNLKNPTRHYDVFVSNESDQSIYTVTVITYESKTLSETPQRLMKALVDELISSNPDNKLLLMGEGIYRGYPALEFSLQNNGAQMDARAFAVGNTLYVLGYRAFAERYRRAEFDYFSESFEIN